MFVFKSCGVNILLSLGCSVYLFESDSLISLFVLFSFVFLVVHL